MNESKKIILELTLDELKLIDKYVELNDETESVFDKIKDAYPQPQMNLQQEGDYAIVSYNDTTYYRFMNETTLTTAWYIKKGMSVTHPALVMINDAETERLLEGLYYNHIEVKKEKVSEWEPTPQTPEQTEQSLKEAFREAQQTEKWKEIQKLIDEEDNDKNFKNSLDLIKEWGENNKPPTLKELLWEWWEDIFTVDSDLDADASIDVLVDRIDNEFIPPSSKKNGYEWEKCLKIMRDKLR